ncbi:hypothetical protein EYF80_030227 [Liparis tanakae]|uniref:Uncharacterized protein n=1 Tax=Liparis tanakae TaxID=230148 RepID=A0A4Z2H126_9TELE|nr:hypothetical protein EYF80_030227 [Liparis tanakae]
MLIVSFGCRGTETPSGVSEQRHISLRVQVSINLKAFVLCMGSGCTSHQSQRCKGQPMED